MKGRRVVSGGLVALLVAVALNLATPRPAEAFIHEIIAALCRYGNAEVIPPGQIRNGNSFIRALIASGLITSIEATPTLVTVHFDPTVPQSKFVSAGFDLLIPDGDSPGVDLLLSPLVVPNPAFPAHANCHNTIF
jgi:hypothetical protein